MLAGVSLGSDSKRYFRGTMPRIAIATIILMPLLYGAMYLWAFWNPFGAVNKIPAAIVNNDTGRSSTGEQVDAGDQVVKSLIASGQLDLAEVSEEDAVAGLADGKYYYTITIPESFTEAAEIMRLQAGAEQLEYQLGNPNSPLQGALATLSNGGLAADVNRLRSGVDELSSGLVQLTAGSVQLADGAGELSSGMVELQSGSQELAQALSQGATQVPNWTDEQRTATAETLSTPVALQQNYTNEAPTFGTGFAPFFLSLALFVGGIITWMLLTPLQSRPTVAGLGAYRTVLASYWPALLVGILQVVVMYTVVHFGVGLDVKHVVGTILFLMLISATYLAMIQAFNAIFGVAVGRVVTLVFLMLQLVSAGGIYPVPTTAKPFQYIHPFDPMTYTVNGLRQLTVAENIDSRLWIAIAVLAGILLVSLTLSALSVRRNRRYTMERLYPPIEV